MMDTVNSSNQLALLALTLFVLAIFTLRFLDMKLGWSTEEPIQLPREEH